MTTSQDFRQISAALDPSRLDYDFVVPQIAMASQGSSVEEEAFLPDPYLIFPRLILFFSQYATCLHPNMAICG